ncbi:Gfo/Idh/MocA family protein [Planctomycetes bacterium K23_9]|uniref:4-carboxy-2-hydroxymuconate-6-semialdehyde dehydrogenase n=1 Tax=Stieleria marina TaxID=1930275 RepID=A0A517NMS2_9BACT|nr:4-carboxy-2-hydroxymuconate-6-semialdehyde dehydrogenase [Planctomycetes bacterium K23_9]
MTKLKGAVIGAGYFSHFHFDAWNRIDEVDLVACCDTDTDKVNSVAQQYAVPNAYTDYRSMLDAHEVDFVDIITRPDTHLEIVTEIASRNTAMICQKPLAPSVDEVRQLIDIVNDSGVRFMVHENFRFQPWYREVKQLLDGGVIGDQLHTLTFRNRAGDGWGDDAYLARQPYFQSMEKFLILEAGIHTIDTFRFLGGEIANAWCVHRKLNPVIAGEDTALGIFQFDGGGMGVYDANRFNESTAENPRYTFGELLVEANGGTIRMYDDARLTVQPLGEKERDHDYVPSNGGFAGDCVYQTQRHFVDGLLNNAAFETDANSYAKSIAVQEAMYRSAKSGTWEKPTL